MVWKVVSVALVFLLLVFSFAIMLVNLPVKPVELKSNYLEPERVAIVDYGAVPVFAENLRFNHNLISYSISEDCDVERRSDMEGAFNVFADEVKIVSFYEVVTGGDILVGCSNEFVELGEELFAAGEGGPSRIINTSGFKVIEEGKVLLYSGRDCDYPIVALHELCHVFGFAHSDDPDNLMYNVSDCGQRMSSDMIELMIDLYSVEALADARISELDAVLHGKYLDFNISILNEGLVGIDGMTLGIVADGEVVEVVDLGEIDIGYGRTLKVENMDVGFGVERVEFVLDAGDVVRELKEDNNVVEMRAR
ncbi:MAG: matrixin family metalloprotease [archaeon]